MSQQMVEAEGVTKRFGKVEALAGLTVAARSGGVLAVLGPNGAGKSTFVRMMATLTVPDAGRLHVAGVDALRHPEQVRALIGLAGQYAAVEEAMTGVENLEMVARLFGFSRRDSKRRAAAVLERLGLADAGNRIVRTWSGACADGSTSGPPWSARPACCCSTSRRPGSTRPAGSRSGKRSASWSPTARTSCSRPNTSTRPTTWPTAS